MVMMMVAVAMIVMVRRGIGADALDVVVVPFLRRAHGRLEADDLGAILAEQAVHVDVAGLDALDPVDERVEHQRMVAQIVRLQELDLGVSGRDLVGLLVDPPHQHAGEQEVGEHHDPLEAEPHRPLQHSVDARLRDPAIADLGPAEAQALPKHPGELADIAVSVRIGGAAADHREQRLAARHRGRRRRQARLDPILRRLQQLRIDAEVPAEGDRQAMLGGIAVQHRGHVVLDVAGGEQHAWHRQDPLDALVAQLVEPLPDHGMREFEEAAGDGPGGQPAGQLVDQMIELRHRRAIARAVAANHDADLGHAAAPVLISPFGYQSARGGTSTPDRAAGCN